MVLLPKSASVTGFFLPHYGQHIVPHMKKLFKAYDSKELHVGMDEKKWTGLNSIPKAIQWLYDGKNSGKIVINLPGTAAL